jgi:hypothetical protein
VTGINHLRLLVPVSNDFQTSDKESSPNPVLVRKTLLLDLTFFLFRAEDVLEL